VLPLAPTDLKERASGWMTLLDMVKQDLENAKIKDWGNFVGESSGFLIIEGTEEELSNIIQKWVPFVRFEAKPFMSVDEITEIVKAWAK